MAQTIAIGPQNFNGQSTVGPASVPVGTSLIILTLDVSGINPASGQLLHFAVSYSTDGGVTWLGCGEADFSGPWTDRQGVLHNDASMSVGFGQVPTADGNGWQPILSEAGWQIRAIITATNGPIHSSGGSLVLQ